MVERSSANLELGLELPLSKLSPAFQEVLRDLDRAWTGVGPPGQAAWCRHSPVCLFQQLGEPHCCPDRHYQPIQVVSRNRLV